MKNYCLLCFLAIFSFSSFAQKIDKVYSDKIQKILVQCDKYTDENKFDSLLIVANSGLQACTNNDNENKSRFHYLVGNAHLNTNEFQKGIANLHEALRLGNLSKNNKLKAQALNSLLFFYTNNSNYTKERDSIFNAIINLLQDDKSDEIGKLVNIHLSNYYSVIGQYDVAIQYLLKDLNYNEIKIKKNKGNFSDSVNYGVSLLNIAETYNTIKNADKAVEYIDKAKPFLQKYQAGFLHCFKDYCDAYVLKNNIPQANQYYDSLKFYLKKLDADASSWSNKIAIDLTFADYFNTQKKYDSAAKYIEYAFETHTQYPQDDFTLNQVNYMAGVVALSQKKYQKALQYLESAEPFLKDWSAEIYVGVLKSIGECYNQMGNWQKAAQYFQQYAPLRDSLYNTASAQSLANAEAIYQNKNKQQQIEVLDKDNKLKQRTTYFLIGGLGLLAVIGLILYRNNSIKQLHNKKLLLLNNELDEANKTKAKLFGIISHDLRSPISQVHQFLKLQQLNPNKLDADEKEKLSLKIQNTTGTLLEAMEELLLWSKTQMNNFVPQICQEHLLPIVQHGLNLLKLNIEAKKINIVQNIPEDLTVKTDEYYLQTILRNLIQNSVKATPNNTTIHINAEMINSKLLLKISNEGKLFTQYDYLKTLQTHESTASLSGLGLQIVNELSLKIDTSIHFENTDNKTVAVVTLST